MQISKVKLPAFAQRYLNEKRQGLSPTGIYELHLNLRHFHFWLKQNRISLRALFPAHVRKFQFRNKNLRPAYYENKARFIRGYLEWLIAQRKCTMNLNEAFPDYYEKWDRQLPSIAEQFQEIRKLHWTPPTVARSEMVISRFHNWLERNKIPLEKLDRNKIEIFLAHLFKDGGHQPSYVHTFKVHLRMYLEWLEAQNEIRANFTDLFPRARDATSRNLSENARKFLKSSANTKKPRTCQQYKVTLNNFYTFSKNKKILIENLNRNDLEDWFTNLLVGKLSPASRVSFILCLRIHLYWLHDHGLLKSDPNHLIKSSDLPNCPKLLPRPLPIDIDQEIQKRLANSDDVYHRALLLMRRTGIRIGELWSLPLDCVRQDHLGNWSLKVPLGKLDSERLVPINTNTLNLVRQIQEQSTRYLNDHGEVLNPMPLLVDPGGFRAYEHRIRNALKMISWDLKTPEPIVTHRLRHSFATELLNGGMSLHNLMTIMGHQSIITTLIYAAVTQETVREEYFAAIEKIKTKYNLPVRTLSSASDKDPVQTFTDVITWLKKGANRKNGPPSRKLELILKRLNRLRLELDQLTNE